MKNALLPVFVLSIVALVFVSGCGPSKNLSLVERRQVVSDMENETLQRLYREEPATKAKIRDSVGYGVFSNANVNLIFASAGTASRVPMSANAVTTKTKTFELAGGNSP